MNTDLEKFIDESIKVSAQHGYYPTTFITMRGNYKTVEAISRLLVSGDIQSGLKRLNKLGLLQWSLESGVLRFPKEFTPQIIECAKFRLKLLNTND